MGAKISVNYDSEKKIWSGPVINSKYHGDTSLGQVIFERIRINPKNVLQINDSENTQLTNEQVLQMSVRLAMSLLEMNLKQTDFIGVMASNTTYTLPLTYGCWFSGIPFHATDVAYDKEAIVHCWKKNSS